ncbi:Uncharacterized protein TCM_023368 [Theobroma cacao]|uniref:Uncharacterized protein n=1 Tax=Theobroma cacao TaxID=3641 RepID=A0A061EW12_THECC|nr:Uncharacterized protein TCM_023368 [Theobroma cacao]
MAFDVTRPISIKMLCFSLQRDSLGFECNAFILMKILTTFRSEIGKVVNIKVIRRQLEPRLRCPRSFVSLVGILAFRSHTFTLVTPLEARVIFVCKYVHVM